MQPEHQTPLAVTGPLARVLALQHLNSVCRGSIVSRASRTLTAFGVSAGVLAQGQFNHSTPLRGLASTFAGENVSAVFLAGQLHSVLRSYPHAARRPAESAQRVDRGRPASAGLPMREWRPRAGCRLRTVLLIERAHGVDVDTNPDARVQWLEKPTVLPATDDPR